MIEIRKSEDRGQANYGWLDTRYTFSFADYFNPKYLGFRFLRVLNEDWIQPGKGFDTHPHRDMEIITYILGGELTHADSMGNGSTIKRGDVQHMTAGSGITHSERNASLSQTTHLLQIWLFPDEKGLKPHWEEKHFSDDMKLDRMCLIASPDGRQDSLPIHQSAEVYAASLSAGRTIEKEVGDGGYCWLQVIDGRLELNENELAGGDGAAISEERSLNIRATERSEFLLFLME